MNATRHPRTNVIKHQTVRDLPELLSGFAKCAKRSRPACSRSARRSLRTTSWSRGRRMARHGYRLLLRAVFRVSIPASARHSISKRQGRVSGRALRIGSFGLRTRVPHRNRTIPDHRHRSKAATLPDLRRANSRPQRIQIYRRKCRHAPPSQGEHAVKFSDRSASWPKSHK